MIDLMDYLLMDPLRSQSHHLEGNANPLYSWRDSIALPTKFAWLKGITGSPWDINLISPELITLWVTEWNDGAPNDFWSDPTCFKKFDANGWTPQGVAFCPRYLLEGGASETRLFTPASKGEHVFKCKTVTPSSVGDIMTITHSPQLSLAADVDIPAGSSFILIEYLYSGKNGIYASRERYYCVKGWGLTQWDFSTPAQVGTWAIKQTTHYNRLVIGGGIAPKFPCF